MSLKNQIKEFKAISSLYPVKQFKELEYSQKLHFWKTNKLEWNTDEFPTEINRGDNWEKPYYSIYPRKIDEIEQINNWRLEEYLKLNPIKTIENFENEFVLYQKKGEGPLKLWKEHHIHTIQQRINDVFEDPDNEGYNLGNGPYYFGFSKEAYNELSPFILPPLEFLTHIKMIAMGIEDGRLWGILSDNSNTASPLFWNEDNTELVEIIYALFLKKSIIINNKNAQFKELASAFGKFLNVKVSNPDSVIGKYLDSKKISQSDDFLMKKLLDHLREKNKKRVEG